MKLYDELISSWLTDLSKYDAKHYDGFQDCNWKETSSKEMILRADMAYQLGAEPKNGIGNTVITTDGQFVSKDEVIVIGDDLNQIKTDKSYCRITLVKVSEENLSSGNELYNFIKKIEFVKYKVNPVGYMNRISFSNNKEAVRVSKQALADGITFKQIGKLLIDKYHENKNIEAVKIIFVTLDEFDYKKFEKQFKESDKITQTIDHMLKNINMDCGVCSLQKVCDEVEGMKELHFGLQNNE